MKIVRNGSLYILCTALLTGTLWSGGYFPTSKWVLTFLILAAAGWELVASIGYGGQTRLLRTPALWLLAVYAVFATSSLLWSVVPGDTEREAALLLAYVGVIFVVRSNLVRAGMAGLASLSIWFVYAASFVSAWGVGTYIYAKAPWAGLLDNVYRAGSTFEYSNALACFGLMALPVTAALYRNSSVGERPLYATAVTLQAAAVILSFSRFGLVALLLMSVYLVAAGWRERVALPLFLALVAALAVAVSSAVALEYQYPLAGITFVLVLVAGSYVLQSVAGPVVMGAGGASARKDSAFPDGRDGGLAGKPAAGVNSSAAAGALTAGAIAAMLAAFFLMTRLDKLKTIVGTRFEDGLTLKRLLPHRLDTWTGTVDSFRAEPLGGSGLGSFYYVYQQHAMAAYTKYAHNLVLQAAVETGLIGAAFMVVFLGYVIALACRRLLTKSDAVIKAYAVSVLVFIAFNIFDWEWYVPALTAWFMLGVACLEVIPLERSKHE